jgi:hypothetical protein
VVDAAQKEASSFELSRSAVLAEQVEALFAKMPAALVAVPVASGALIAVLWAVVARERLLIWFGAQVIVTVIRGLTWSQFAQSGKENPERWAKLYTLGIAASGLLWGLGGVWIYPENQLAYEVIVTMFVAGMAAGSVTSAQPYPPAAMSFVALSVVPIAIRMGLDADHIHLVMAGIAVFFGAMLLGIVRTGARSIIGTFELRVKNEQMAASLEAKLSELEQARTGQDQTRHEVARLRQLLDQAGLGLFIIKANSLEIVDVSEHALVLLELTRDQAMAPALTIADLAIGENLSEQKSWQSLARKTLERQHLALNTTRVGADGKECELELLISQTKFEDQDYMLVLFRPIDI